MKSLPGCSRRASEIGDLLIILFIILPAAGTSRLKEVVGGLAEASRNFRREASGHVEINITPGRGPGGEKNARRQENSGR